MFGDHKSQLESLLEEKDEEAHKFSSRIEDLEMQLIKEQEDCKRITSKIRKFIRAHGRYLKAQEELKRSQARLERFGDHLGSDSLKPNEEDSSVNFASDGEPNVDELRSPRKDELQSNPLIKKRQLVYAATSEEAQIVNFQKKKRFSGMVIRSEKLTMAEEPLQFQIDNKAGKPKKAFHTKKDVHKSVADEYRHKQGKIYSGVPSLDKVKSSEIGHMLPSTSMAAHAIDNIIEAIEIDEKSQGKDTTPIDHSGDGDNRAGLSYVPPPPPPVAQNAYKQYEADDEYVEVEKVDLEMLDLNSEVEIEQL